MRFYLSWAWKEVELAFRIGIIFGWRSRRQGLEVNLVVEVKKESTDDKLGKNRKQNIS
jgi:hypothetical protein